MRNIKLPIVLFLTCTVNAAGNSYVTGYAGSTDFPVTAGAFQETK